MTIIGHDIAFSKSVKSDWSVFVILTVSNKPHKIIQHIGKEKHERLIENPIIVNRIIRRKSVDIEETERIYKTTNGNYLYVKPFNDSARGMQPNYIIYDDILRIEDSNTTAEDKEEIFWSVFYPAGQFNNTT